MDKRNSLPELNVFIATDDEHPPSPHAAIYIEIGRKTDGAAMTAGFGLSLSADSAERFANAILAAVKDWREHAATSQ